MIGPSSASSEKEGKTKEMPEKSDPHKHYILQTGQITCHDTSGRMIDGDGSGQDADFRRGVFWPAPRFEVLDDAVLDRLTGLAWTRNAITPAIIYHNLSSPLVGDLSLFSEGFRTSRNDNIQVFNCRLNNIAEFPLAWQEAFDYIATMNHDNVFGSSDWRLPNRRELRSLMSHQTRKPALPEEHPFVNVFSGW